MPEVLDVTRDNDTDEITQFLILGDDGQPSTKVASPENLLLYDPADELPFDGGMYDFMSGDSALRLCNDPQISVGQSGDEYSYVLNLDGNVVETTPAQADDLLQGVYDLIANDDVSGLTSLHAEIIKNQVRRNIVNILAQTFEEKHRIEIVANGWLVDDFYLVDWNAKMYTKDDDPEEGDYVRDRNSDTGVSKDDSYEFVRLSHRINNADTAEVEIGGKNYTLSEREMLFLSKITWLLNRRHYHTDTPFWEFADKWATVEEEEPNLDVFDI
jgi:hypothetical protein